MCANMHRAQRNKEENENNINANFESAAFRGDTSTVTSMYIVCVYPRGDERSRNDGDCAEIDDGDVESTDVDDNDMRCDAARKKKCKI